MNGSYLEIYFMILFNNITIFKKFFLVNISLQNKNMQDKKQMKT